MFKRHLHGWLPVFVLALSVIAFHAGSAQAAKRVALLIGNEKYEATSQLNNPANDVELMKTSFEDAGFDTVTAVHDLDRASMVRALRDFEDTAAGADVAIIYYSGHGMEMNGENFLLPVDVSLKTDKDVEDEAIPLDRVQRSLEGATRLKLVILDACRNNPFEQSMSRSISTRAVSRGLARVEPESADLLVAFASKAGTVAMDGEGKNSPFATALSKYLTEPGVDVRIALGKVRDDVVTATNREQEPFVYGSLGGAQIFPQYQGSEHQHHQQRQHAGSLAKRPVRRRRRLAEYPRSRRQGPDRGVPGQAWRRPGLQDAGRKEAEAARRGRPDHRDAG